MDSDEAGLPPPPPVVPSNVVPELVPVKKRILLPMARHSSGTKGQKINLLTNHFRVDFNKTSGFFYQYSVAISYEDGSPVEAKGIGRKILDKVQETYHIDLGSKYFAYDGEKTLFTVGALPSTKLDFSVVLEDMSSSRNNTGNGIPSETNDADRKRSRRPYQSKRYMVEISCAKKIPMQAIASALQGKETDNLQDAIRVLDIILRQNAARQGCLLVRQSFFHNDPQNFSNMNIGGGVIGCRGFHSSFRTTQGGLSLNIDVSTAMIVQPGPVVDFLLANQGVKDRSSIKWDKAKRTLKNLRVKVTTSNRECKITGLSPFLCKDQVFTRKVKNDKGEFVEVETTVLKYFEDRNIFLRYSANLPCIDVGKPKRPTYIPIEHCDLVSLQRYTKSLTNFQRAALVEKSRQKPQERMASLTKGLKNSNYNADPVLQESGVSIGTNFTQVEGRILQPPKLKVGKGEVFAPRDGRWNFNNKEVFEPTTVTRWAVVNFSARCDTRGIIDGLMKCGKRKGINVEPPFHIVFEENPQFTRAPAVDRVEKMFQQLESTLKIKPLFLLCILSERKNSDVYGPWKKKNLVERGIMTQCIAPPTKGVNDQYLTNVLLKMNARLGGLNSMLDMERSRAIPLVSRVPTIIIGMDVSHGSPGQSDVPSIAAVVSSREWPMISKYRACVRTQSRKVEMIDNLFKRVSDKDEGIMRELLDDFKSSCGRKPEHIIIFRDGVSESQFNQVLNIELDQIMQACKFLDETWDPKFTVIIAQKNHHTKFFQTRSPQNVPPGTIIDRNICHPSNNDFYLCAHAGMIGTTRPTHYHVLYDEIGFSTDDLQELVHSLSYVYQRSTTAQKVKEYVQSALFPEAGLDEGVGQAGGVGGLVVVRDLDHYSYCESCLLPFHVRCHIGYVPSGQRVLGLSKFSRVADVFAKRLQEPQRLADDICSALQHWVKPSGVAVVLQCSHIHFQCLDLDSSSHHGFVKLLVSSGSGVFEDESSSLWGEFLSFLMFKGVKTQTLSRNGGSWCPSVKGSLKFSPEEDPEMISAVITILKSLGEDPSRKELVATPNRFLKWMMNFQKTNLEMKLNNGFNSVKVNGEVKETRLLHCELNLPFWSMCEHHLLPFYGVVHIGYFVAEGSNTNPIGSSLVKSIVHFYGFKLQVQERMTRQIAETLSPLVGGDVIVVAEAGHTCMISRGIEKFGSSTATIAVLGRFSSENSARASFLDKIHTNNAMKTDYSSSPI